jgi:hypothetical protein
VGPQEQGVQEDARLRPRRAHHNAARRGKDPPGAQPTAAGWLMLSSRFSRRCPRRLIVSV